MALKIDGEINCLGDQLPGALNGDLRAALIVMQQSVVRPPHRQARRRRPYGNGKGTYIFKGGASPSRSLMALPTKTIFYRIDTRQDPRMTSVG